jgi:hypothetical protein
MDMHRLLLTTLAGIAIACAFPSGAREVLALDDHWRFLQGDVLGADQPGYDDSRWQVVPVPHDWSSAGTFSETNPAGGAGAYLPTGTAWYRTRFPLSAEDLGRCVSLEFDGVMQNCDAWINGFHLGHHTNGYARFRYELPLSMLGIGGGTNNVLAVCADTSAPPAYPWYTGSGIYRQVRLVIEDPVHIVPDGLVVETPDISPDHATVLIQTILTNESAGPHEISLQTALRSPDDEPVGFLESSQTVGAHAPAILEQQITIPSPQLWNLDAPKLYQAATKLRLDGQLTDTRTTVFAIRKVAFESDGSFVLNGKKLALQGVSLHSDGGAFGAAVPLAIWNARLRTLKALGANAVRWEHVAPTEELIDLCERLGLLVLNDVTAPVAQNLVNGIDYLGESQWPRIGHDSGLLDRTGAVTPLGREWQSQWSHTPMVAMARRVASADDPERAARAADWTPEVLKPHTENVEVYSNCKEVELFLNGKSLGKRGTNAGAGPRQWTVPFAPGVLKAVAREGRGRIAGTNELRTAGKAAAIVLATETNGLSSDWNTVAIVRATVIDAKGVPVPGAGNWISFAVSGPGVIAAVDNADSASHERFQTNACPAVHGRCVAFVKAGPKPGRYTVAKAGTVPGRITVTAVAPGLKAGSLVIKRLD